MNKKYKKPDYATRKKMRKLTEKAEAMEFINDMRDLLGLNGISMLTGIPYSTIQKLVSKEKSPKKITIQTHMCIKKLHEKYQNFLQDTEIIRQYINSFDVRRDTIYAHEIESKKVARIRENIKKI